MLELIGAPFAFGQPQAGVAAAPRALRDAGLRTDCDRGDLDASGPPSACLRRLHDETRDALISGNRALVVGGDHSLSLGSISGALAASPDLRVLWVDAHGDMNTPLTSPTGRLHGMPIAGLLGEYDPGFSWMSRRLRADRLVLFGVRDLDPGEEALIRRRGLVVYTMERIRALGPDLAIAGALSALGANGPIHVSFDIDALDPFFAPATGTPVPGGLNPDTAARLMRAVAGTGRVRSMDLVEVNPELAPWGHGGQATLDAAISLARTALGHRPHEEESRTALHAAAARDARGEA